MQYLAFLLQNHPDPAMVQQVAMVMLTVVSIFILVAVAAILPPFWMIFKKAGLSPWLCLLMIIPLVNIITLWVIAFTTWNVVPAPPFGWQPQPPYPPQPPKA
ncbi:MAG: hypothetical protein WAK26_19020 [Terracidiphilus sp.]|jgi:hypothetical protein